MPTAAASASWDSAAASRAWRRDVCSLLMSAVYPSLGAVAPRHGDTARQPAPAGAGSPLRGDRAASPFCNVVLTIPQAGLTASAIIDHHEVDYSSYGT